MAVLGKRKAPEPSISEEEAQEIFRRHFEARFNPLPGSEVKPSRAEDDSDDDDGDDGNDLHDDEENGIGSGEGSEWGGLSDDEISEDEEDDVPTVEVVDHSVSQAPKTTTMSKRELRAFMSSRIPDQTASSKASNPSEQTPSSSASALPEDAPSLLAQDLELRRLIAESHLLAPHRPTSLSSLSFSTSTASSSSSSEPKTFATGRIRQKAIDLRVQALGSKTSILKQDKMPMNMRKGINAAAADREAKRRREARENGVILEKEMANKKKKTRDRRGAGFGVDRPGVGRLRGAELRLSERDVKSIEGKRDTFGKKRGKRR